MRSYPGSPRTRQLCKAARSFGGSRGVANSGSGTAAWRGGDVWVAARVGGLMHRCCLLGWRGGGSFLLTRTATASPLSWLLPGGEHVVLGMQSRAACGFGDVKRADALMPGMQDFTEGFVQWSSGCRDVHLRRALVCVHIAVRVARTRWKVCGLGTTCCCASSRAESSYLSAKPLGQGSSRSCSRKCSKLAVGCCGRFR